MLIPAAAAPTRLNSDTDEPSELAPALGAEARRYPDGSRSGGGRVVEDGHLRHRSLRPSGSGPRSAEAEKLMIRVSANRARPAAIRAEVPKDEESCVEVGDQGRDRVAAGLEHVEVGGEDRRDDEDHDDGFAQGPAQPEHRPTDDAALAEREGPPIGSSPSGSHRGA